jgi:hypothetical protein
MATEGHVVPVVSGPDPGLCLTAEDHVRRHPDAQVADLYKFAHHAAFGPGHAISNPEQARHRLEAEFASVSQSAFAKPSEPLLEPLLPDGSLVRVHLRPWVEAGLDPELLLSAFVHTANTHRGSSEILKDYWRCFEQLTDARVLHLRPDALAAFLDERESEGWPPYHHSDTFEASYAPAYRVVSRSYLPELPGH